MMRRLQNFLNEEHGAGTVFMVLLLPAFLALAGLAIDAANAYRTRAILQGAADAASLAATLSLPDTNAAAAAAINYAKMNLPNNGPVLAAADVEAGNWNAATQTFTKGGTPTNSVRVTTRMTATNGNALPTAFLKIIGIDHWDISAQAISVADQPKLWVALVLDNSGSMCQDASHPTISGPCPTPYADSKITALKTGANNLVTTLKKAAAHPGDVQVSIVPFTKNVGLGTAYVNASWLNWSDFNRAPPAVPTASVGPNSSCPWTTNSNGYACQVSPANGAPTTTKIPASGAYAGYICPTADKNGHYYNGCYNSVKISGSGTTTKYSHTWISNAKSTWTGCVMDRDQAFDTLDTLPSTGGTMFWPENNQDCPISTLTAMHALTTDSDLSFFSGQINALSANGWTNQAIGVDTGWLTITPGMPLNPVPPALPADTQRYIVLFSDGFNTFDRWTKSPNGNVRDTVADARTEAACDNAKKEGVVIFTVYVDLAGTTGASDVLEHCASEPKSDYYFPLTTANGIITTFDKIGQRIMKMRLVR